MRIQVLAKTKSRQEKVERLSALTGIDKTILKVSVKQLPIDGKANKAIIKLLAKYYQIPRSRIRLISGEHSKHKHLEISE